MEKRLATKEEVEAKFNKPNRAGKGRRNSVRSHGDNTYITDAIADSLDSDDISSSSGFSSSSYDSGSSYSDSSSSSSSSGCGGD